MQVLHTIFSSWETEAINLDMKVRDRCYEFFLQTILETGDKNTLLKILFAKDVNFLQKNIPYCVRLLLQTGGLNCPRQLPHFSGKTSVNDIRRLLLHSYQLVVMFVIFNSHSSPHPR